MSKPVYIQIFSLTDHAQALQGRFEGPYQGVNSELQTSEMKNGSLRVSKQTKAHQMTIPENYFDNAKAILAYRHSDTGVLTGTSETLFSIEKLPWEQMPGFTIQSAKKNTVALKMWDQEMVIEKDSLYRIHFGKTVVYLKNFGEIENLEWTKELLSDGPAQLHSESVDESITIAPPSGSALQIKMGQETQN